MADEKNLAKELADEIVPAFTLAMSKHINRQGVEEAVAFSRLEKDVEQHNKDIEGLKKVVYEQHEPIIIWSRNFSDSYRKIVTAVIISGLITLVGFLAQMYYLTQKLK